MRKVPKREIPSRFEKKAAEMVALNTGAGDMSMAELRLQAEERVAEMVSGTPS